MRIPVSRMFQRTIFACRSLKTAPTFSLSKRGSPPSGTNAAITFPFTASTAA